jgi:hypothetical protein
MIECYVIELLKAKNVRDLTDVESALASASEFWTPSHVKGEGTSTHNSFPHFHIRIG